MSAAAPRLKVGLRGARAHTARPWMGRNAIHRLAGLLAEVAAYEARTPTIDGCTYKESVQVISVEGGVAGNLVPEANSLPVAAKLGWADVARFSSIGVPAANFGPGGVTIAHT